MAPFEFRQNQDYEIDRRDFDEACRRHGLMNETSRLGWFVASGEGPPKIVVSEAAIGGLTIYGMVLLSTRMRESLRAVQKLTEEMFDRLVRVDGAEREQVERVIVAACKLLDIWHVALGVCTAQQERVIEASRSVAEKLRSALTDLDLRNPEVFGRLVHQLNLDIQATIGECREPRLEEHSAVA